MKWLGWTRNYLAEFAARVLLNTQLKIGQFSFSVQDLVIPVSGLPLTVTRTYNSFSASSQPSTLNSLPGHSGATAGQPTSDFAPGWTYAINDVNLQLDEDREMASDVVDDEQYSLRTSGGRDVTLTLPDGRRATFQFYYDGPYGSDSKYYAKWHSPAGVNYTLTASGNPYYVAFHHYWQDGYGTLDTRGCARERTVPVTVAFKARSTNTATAGSDRCWLSACGGCARFSPSIASSKSGGPIS